MFVLFVIGPSKMAGPDPVSGTPSPAGSFTVHENVVPDTLLLKGTFNEFPLQTLIDVGSPAMSGLGFTTALIVIGVPSQPLTRGVTVYVAVAGANVLLNRVWKILFPEPGEAPVIPGAETVHVHTVFNTSGIRSISMISPVQIGTGAAAVTVGRGFTVIVNTTGSPTQAGPPTMRGSKVYVTV